MTHDAFRTLIYEEAARRGHAPGSDSQWGVAQWAESEWERLGEEIPAPEDVDAEVSALVDAGENLLDESGEDS